MSCYDSLILLSKKQQLVILELFANNELRSQQIYKKEIFNSYQELYRNMKDLVNRHYIQKIAHNHSNVTYRLTPKGVNLAVLIADDELRFNTIIKDLVIILNIGHTKPDLMKNVLEYHLKPFMY